ncbi:MAG TPA: hypothetical protein VGK67_20455, partial [Myxococcales bacterium]
MPSKHRVASLPGARAAGGGLPDFNASRNRERGTSPDPLRSTRMRRMRRWASLLGIPGSLEGAVAVALYLGLMLLWKTWGGTLRIPYSVFQYLPSDELRDHLARSLLDLHGQPPVLNLLLGIALKLDRATSVAAEEWLTAFNVAVGAATCVALAALARRLLPGAGLRWLLLGLVLLNPYFYASLSFFFYPPLETLLLTATALAVARYVELPTAPRLAWFFAPALLLLHTRSLFHPAWLLAIVGALLLWTRHRQARGPLRLHAEIAVLGMLLSLAWPAKNFYRFGFFGFSSWQGLNLARGLPIASETFDRIFQRRAFMPPPSPELEAFALAGVPEELRDRPTLTRTTKPDGSANWNHYLVLKASKEVGPLALKMYLDSPGIAAAKIVRLYARGYTRYEGRDPYSGELAGGEFTADVSVAPRWAALYEALVFQPFRAYDRTAPSRLTTGFSALFPALMLVCFVALWLRRRQRGPEEAAIAFAVLSIVWVFVLVVGVDGVEGNRMRYPTEGLFFL